MNTKTCTQCLQEMTIDNFYKKARGRFGVAAICKKCDNFRSAIWRSENKARKKITDRNWQKNNKQRKRQSQKNWETKNAESERIRKAKLYQMNKELWRERGAVWAKANREKVNAKKRKWRSKNPDKTRAENLRNLSRLRQNGIFLILPKELRRLTNATHCFYCDQTMNKVTIDHVIPRSKGGRHSIGNLVACCGSCNSSKGAKTITEWRLR